VIPCPTWIFPSCDLFRPGPVTQRNCRNSLLRPTGSLWPHCRSIKTRKLSTRCDNQLTITMTAWSEGKAASIAPGIWAFATCGRANLFISPKSIELRMGWCVDNVEVDTHFLYCPCPAYNFHRVFISLYTSKLPAPWSRWTAILVIVSQTVLNQEAVVIAHNVRPSQEEVANLAGIYLFTPFRPRRPTRDWLGCRSSWRRLKRSRV
jgi:hypothetical protein